MIVDSISTKKGIDRYRSRDFDPIVCLEGGGIPALSGDEFYRKAVVTAPQGARIRV